MTTQGDFHEIDGHTYPRVTSLLKVIDKSGPIAGWSVKIEREAIRNALEEALTRPGDLQGQQLWNEMEKHFRGQRAAVKKQDEAANIGRSAHALIEWHTRKMLGMDVGPEPTVSDAALRAVVAWLDWTKAVGFTPLASEIQVYCRACAYAGTIDTVAKVAGVITVIDYKTSKAIYPEALLQVNFYRHAAKASMFETGQAMVVRLPKVAEDPITEMLVAPIVPLRCLRAIATTWRTMRWMEGKPHGDAPAKEGCS